MINRLYKTINTESTASTASKSTTDIDAYFKVISMIGIIVASLGLIIQIRALSPLKKEHQQLTSTYGFKHNYLYENLKSQYMACLIKFQCFSAIILICITNLIFLKFRTLYLISFWTAFVKFILYDLCMVITISIIIISRKIPEQIAKTHICNPLRLILIFLSNVAVISITGFVVSYTEFLNIPSKNPTELPTTQSATETPIQTYNTNRSINSICN